MSNANYAACVIQPPARCNSLCSLTPFTFKLYFHRDYIHMQRQILRFTQDDKKNIGWAKRSVPTLAGRWAHCVLRTLLWLPLKEII
jgi:hypothetical protein